MRFSTSFSGMLAALAIGMGFVCPPAAAAKDEGRKRLTDEQGRELIPGGYVVLESIRYTEADYRRMIRMGANFQVIRMPIGVIGAWPGEQADEKALAHFDELVRMGKAAGMQTMFKLVFYGVRPFGDKQWDMLWNNTDGTQDKLIEGWIRIWNRYKDEPSVFGYDLLNEPARGLDEDYETIQSAKMLPLLRRMTDEMHAISPGKWALYQPLLRKPEDQIPMERDPVVAINEPFGRERVIYAPHLYQMKTTVIGPMLDAFEHQAAISNAPLLLGEWGSPTYSDTDGNATQEALYTKVYQATVHELDKRCIGGIKAWFCGARTPIPVKGPRKWMTWSIFSDKSPAGIVERKYILDVVVRPRPLVVAGSLEHYGNDFAARSFQMTVNADPGLGATEIFVPAERHFPDGFLLEVGSGLTLVHDSDASGFRGLHAASPEDREQAKKVRWDEANQRVVILNWAGPARKLVIKVRPKEQDLGSRDSLEP